MTDAASELARRAQAGDANALAELVRAQQTYVYSIALGLMRNPADAADMTQEAFIRVIRSLHTYRGETKFTTWLYRLATNVCLDGLRRRAVLGPQGREGRPFDSRDAPDEDDAAGQLPDDDPWGAPDASYDRRESAAELRAALSHLSAAQRLALTLHYIDGMRYEDVAAIMDVRLNTAKSHIRRGKQQLARALRRSEHGSERETCGATG